MEEARFLSKETILSVFKEILMNFLYQRNKFYFLLFLNEIWLRKSFRIISYLTETIWQRTH